MNHGVLIQRFAITVLVDTPARECIEVSGLAQVYAVREDIVG